MIIYLRSLHGRKARSYPGVPKHILGRLSGKCGMCPSFLFGSRHSLYLYFFCCVGFAESACPMTFGRVATVQPKAVTLVNPLSSYVRQDVVPNAVNIKKHRLTPLERELEAVEGISLTELGQPVAEVVGRVSIVTPTTASRARFHPQLWQCFLDQSWPDKELVVVETYHNEPSAFFESIARVDSRLKYVAIKRPVGEDLTVGTKGNLTILLASGQYTSSTLTMMISMPTDMWSAW